MNSPPPSQRSVQKFGGSGLTRVKAATIWLCLVAVATVLNSLILFKYSRFIDLVIGLSFTQFIDAVFVGMQLEPPGAPWWWTALPALVLDAPFVLSVIVLAVKVSHRKRRATQVSFWLYTIDTALFALMFGWSLWASVKENVHAPSTSVLWGTSTLIAHTFGVIIILRAWRAVNEIQVVQNEIS